MKKNNIFSLFIICFFAICILILFNFKAGNTDVNSPIYWYKNPYINKSEFISKYIIPLLGTPSPLRETSPLIKIHDFNYFYQNPLNERVPVTILNYPKQPENEYYLNSKAIVIAIHETNKVGGEEPCGQAGKEEMFYGKMLAEQGYIVACPTLTFTGKRQPTNHWDTTEFYKKYPNWSALGKDIAEISWLLDSMKLSGFNINKIALVGHSQGAIYAIFSAALDERIDTVIANAGFVVFKQDPHPERWSRNSWYKALPYIPNNFTYAELVATISPRNVLICNYLQDEILIATFPDTEVKDIMAKFPSIHWAFFNGKHGWPSEVKQFAFSWLSQKFPVKNISN
ncbi:hypothetical protein LC653_09910 [Nostoc sp. CHAB 5784]|uniref:hypothetical protein n=1 Tax=Nostoc mirabile TaxID=2907820 RepID=UPI001E632E35|nr:hypothetical protein [Nostoc mirabile]MCC5664224.1 hypothetical protein [Nostoc mirabile CHAB5784]